MKNSIYEQLNNGEWLKEQILAKKTITDIANEVGCERGAVLRALKRFNLEKPGRVRFPQLYDKEWLTEELHTKSIKRIADEIGSTTGNVGYRARMLGISLGTTKSEAIKASLKKKFPNGRYGELASNWRGGRGRVNGYMTVHIPVQDRTGKNARKFEHVSLIEDRLGRELDHIKEVVHHIDADKLNNDIDNLIVLTRGQHIKIHHDSYEIMIKARKAKTKQEADKIIDEFLKLYKIKL